MVSQHYESWFAWCFYPQADQPLKSDAGLPGGWEVRHSKSKNLPYFFNAATKESRWEYPDGTDTDTLKAYIDQHHGTAAVRPDGRGANEGKIRAAHILVKHKNSRKPSSWRSDDITRTKEEAISLLEGYEERIRSGEITLRELAVTESDCNSARKKGDLSVFDRVIWRT